MESLDVAKTGQNKSEVLQLVGSCKGSLCACLFNHLDLRLAVRWKSQSALSGGGA